MSNKETTAKRIRGVAKLAIHQREALWKDMVEDAKHHDDLQYQAKMRTIVADRLWPKLKPVGQTLNLEVPEGLDLDGKVNLLLDAALTGKADLESVTALIGAIDKAYSIKDRHEFEKRLEAIEEAQNEK